METKTETTVPQPIYRIRQYLPYYNVTQADATTFETSYSTFLDDYDKYIKTKKYNEVPKRNLLLIHGIKAESEKKRRSQFVKFLKKGYLDDTFISELTSITETDYRIRPNVHFLILNFSNITKKEVESMMNLTKKEVSPYSRCVSNYAVIILVDDEPDFKVEGCDIIKMERIESD